MNMKWSIVDTLILAFVVILACLVIVGCVSAAMPATDVVQIPPLPPEIAMLSEQFGEPKIAEAYATVLIWEIAGVRYHVLLIYDPFIGEWLIQYYKYSGVSSPRAVY